MLNTTSIETMRRYPLPTSPSPKARPSVQVDLAGTNVQHTWAFSSGNAP